MDKMHAIWKKVKGDWSRAHSRYRLLKRQRRRRREWRKKKKQELWKTKAPKEIPHRWKIRSERLSSWMCMCVYVAASEWNSTENQKALFCYLSCVRLFVPLFFFFRIFALLLFDVVCVWMSSALYYIRFRIFREKPFSAIIWYAIGKIDKMRIKVCVSTKSKFSNRSTWVNRPLHSQVFYVQAGFVCMLYLVYWRIFVFFCTRQSYTEWYGGTVVGNKLSSRKCWIVYTNDAKCTWSCYSLFLLFSFLSAPFHHVYALRLSFYFSIHGICYDEGHIFYTVYVCVYWR